MIIFGSRNAYLGSAPVHNISCPSCQNINTLQFSIYRKHAHIFWIPVFPVQKEVFAHCSHCKYTMTQKEMPEQIKKRALKAKQDSKSPIWQFSGSIIIGLLALFLMFSTSKKKDRELGYLEAPRAGDVYKYKVEAGRYTTLKVQAFQNDSVYLAPNAYETDKLSGLYRIDKDSSYLDEVYGFSRREIDSMYNSGRIYGIQRR